MKITATNDKITFELEHQAEIVAFRWALNGSGRAREVLKKAILATKHTEESTKVLTDIMDRTANSINGLELPVRRINSGPAYCAAYDPEAFEYFDLRRAQ